MWNWLAVRYTVVRWPWWQSVILCSNMQQNSFILQHGFTGVHSATCSHDTGHGINISGQDNNRWIDCHRHCRRLGDNTGIWRRHVTEVTAQAGTATVIWKWLEVRHFVGFLNRRQLLLWCTRCLGRRQVNRLVGKLIGNVLCVGVGLDLGLPRRWNLPVTVTHWWKC